MNTHIELVKLLIDTVAKGNLVLSEENGRVRFELRFQTCSIKGALITRWDWSNAQGRPGLMSIIERVEIECSQTTHLELFEWSRKVEGVVYDLLQERLTPERLCTFDPDYGWMLTAFNSPGLHVRDEAAAYSSV